MLYWTSRPKMLPTYGKKTIRFKDYNIITTFEILFEKPKK